MKLSSALALLTTLSAALATPLTNTPSDHPSDLNLLTDLDLPTDISQRSAAPAKFDPGDIKLRECYKPNKCFKRKKGWEKDCKEYCEGRGLKFDGRQVCFMPKLPLMPMDYKCCCKK